MAEDIKNNIDSKPAKTGEGVSQNVSEGNSINSMLNKPMPPKPPAPPTVLNKPAAGTAKKTDNTSDKKASIASAAKKVAQAKKIIDRKSYKAPDKKKSLLVGIFAFMLAGGAIFIMMIMMGTKDIKNQDARMNFSYSNVLAGAVAPLFEALGVKNSPFSEEAAIRRMDSRLGGTPPLSIEDWIGKNESPSLKMNSFGSKSASGGRTGSYSSSDYSSSSEPMPRADFGMGGGGFGGGGGSSTSSSGRGGSNSFASTSVKDAIDFKNGDKSGGQSLPAMKGKNAINTLTASRKMLSGALTSGSANVARSNWNASFGQGQARATGGSTSGFNNGKIDKSAFKDANAVALDRIESGEIMNLKNALAENRGESVPSASVPKTIYDESKNEDPADKLAKQALQAAGDGISSGLSGGGSDSSASSGGMENLKAGESPAEVSSIAEKMIQAKESERDTWSDETGDYEYTFKDDGKPSYRQSSQGFWMATYKGTETRYYKDENGKERIEKYTYEDTYVIVPGGKPEKQKIGTKEKDKTGRTSSFETY